jgi:DNA mismatch repair protein MutS2
MNPKALVTLEFTRVRERLADLTSFSAGRELALRLEPFSDIQAVERLLDETTQANTLLSERPEFGVRSAHDVRDLAKRAGLGGILDPIQLLEVLDTVRAGQYVAGVLTKLDERFRRLQDLAAGIQLLRDVSDDIEHCINDQGEILDRASPALGRIRHDLKAAHNRLVERVNSYLTSHRAMLQDAIVTTRNDRYVIPIKAEFKNQIKGIVHDQSASGATFFIEPLEIMELNNAWRSLQIAEQQEIDRILRALSARVGEHAEGLIDTVGALAEVDLVLAKVKLAGLQNASRPMVEEHGMIDLEKARHPLLTGNVVPISVRLQPDRFMLVITGPNTGGKTVALKTIGLLSLMAQAGLWIPAADGSVLTCQREVWADIGDEQSIEQSLSTFSSHMTNIVRILREVQPDDLVLLDELGAGTDPVEGSALARSILQYLRARRIRTVATTHYSELKAYAHTQEGVQNAAVEFDLETLSPTYRLMLGLPGRSNALAIARRLGVPEEIVAGATEMLAPDQVRVESLLESIASEQRETTALRRQVETHERELRNARSKLDEELAALERRKDKILDDAQRLAEADVAATRRRLEQIVQEAARTGADRHQVREAEFEAAAVLREVGERRERHRQARRRLPHTTQTTAEPLAPGSWVRVRSLDQVARLSSIQENRGEAEVLIGSLKAKVKVSDLQPATRAEARVPEDRVAAPAVPVSSLPVPSVGLELDLRGQRP